MAKRTNILTVDAETGTLHRNRSSHNYDKALRYPMETGLLRGVGAAQVRVRHDGCCGIYRGRLWIAAPRFG